MKKTRFYQVQAELHPTLQSGLIVWKLFKTTQNNMAIDFNIYRNEASLIREESKFEEKKLIV